MKITFIGAAHEVTGSCYYLEAAGKKFLVDCGMEQGPDYYENQEIPVKASDLDFVLLTHAHMDHSGNLPAIYAQGFQGPIYATDATCHLCDIMLRDSAHIQMFEAEWRNRKGRRQGKPEFVPAYTMEDAMGVLKNFVPCHYETTVTPAPRVQQNIHKICRCRTPAGILKHRSDHSGRRHPESHCIFRRYR